MSLINQMLKDLEARQKSKEPASPIAGLSSGKKARAKKPVVSKKFLFIILPAFAVVIVGLLFTGDKKSSKNELTSAISAAKTPVNTTAAPSASTASAPPAPAMPETAYIDNAPAGVQLTIEKIAFTPDRGGEIGNLSFTLFDNSHYYDFSMKENGKMASIIFYNTKILPEATSDLTSNTFFSSVTTQPSDYNTETMIKLKQGIRVAGLDLDETASPPVLVLSLKKTMNNQVQSVSKKETTPQNDDDEGNDAGSMKKVNVPLTQNQKAERLRTEAVNLARRGKMLEALNSLTRGRITYPDYTPIVETLVSLLLDDGQTVAAQAMLAQAMMQSPRHIPFIVLQAKIIAAQGDTAQAIELLNTVSPTLEQHPDYFSLLANLYQRAGDTEISAQMYRELVTYDPDSGVWWMGYGMALEANGSRNHAIQAYKRATTTGNLNSKLQMYSNSRIAALGG